MNNKEEQLKELEELKELLLYIQQYIEDECVYDEHLQGYVFDLPKGKVRTLMYQIKQKTNGGKNE